MSNMTMPVWEFRQGDPLIIWMASDMPATTPSLTANLICRVTFGIIANLVCLVPLRILYANGELAAVVFIANVEVKNLLTVVNALLWRDNDVETWWPGYGLCDVVPYLSQFMTMLYVTALLAITRNVATQVGLLRVNPLTAQEKRRRNLVQTLIIFPLPLLQVGLTWLIQAQRFAVGTLVGCTFVGYQTWVYVVFFIVPPLLVACVTVFYAVLTYVRYRELAKTVTPVLASNSQAQSRAERTRRRLYLMVLSVLVPFLPMIIALAVLNILDIDEVLPYDYDAIHNYTEPWGWNTIAFLRSSDFDWLYMNIAYIPIVAAVPIFLFFGTTKDAINDYRRILLLLGLGTVLPSLYQEYDPDRRQEGGQASSNFNSLSSSRRNAGKLGSFAASLRHVSPTSSSSRSTATAAAHDVELHSVVIASKGQDLEAQRPSQDGTVEIPPRNPWLLCTHLVLPHIPLPTVPRASKSRTRADDANLSQVSLRSFRGAGGMQHPNPVQTHVWSAEGVAAPGSRRQERRGSSGDGNERHGAYDDVGSVRSAEGVVVETHLVTETHRASGAP